MLRLKIKNFRGVPAADIVSEKPIIVFSGENGAGKTSIAAAIEFALTGGACGLRGRDTQYLVRRGTTSMRVAIDVDEGLLAASRTPSTGTPLQAVSDQVGTPATLLPLLFQPAAALVDGGKLIRNYLRVLAEARPTALEAAGTAQELIPLAEQIRATTTPGILGEIEAKRAENQQQTPPVRPTQPRPNKAQLEELTQGAKRLQGEVERLERLHGGAAATVANLEAVPVLHQQLAQFRSAEKQRTAYQARRAEIDELRAIIAHTRAAEAYRVAAEKRAADPLAHCRAGLVELSKADPRPVVGFAAMLERAGLAEEASKARAFNEVLQRSIQACQDELRITPAPAGLPPEPTPLSPEMRARWAALLEGGTAAIEPRLREAEAGLGPQPASARQPFVAPNIEPLLALDLPAYQVALQEAQSALTEVAEQLAGAKAQVAGLAGQLVEAEVGERQWRDFDAANNGIAERNQRSKEMWDRYQALRTRFEQLILQKQAEGCDAFLRDLEALGSVYFQGRRLQLSPEGALALGSVPLVTLSGSEQWRVGALITATIAKRAQCPILVLDGADILDHENRRGLSSFLKEHVSPHFSHVLLLATPKRTLAEEFRQPLPPFIDRFLVSQGEVLPEQQALTRLGIEAPTPAAASPATQQPAPAPIAPPAPALALT